MVDTGGNGDIASDGRLRNLELEVSRLDERQIADRLALKLQAEEYARRLKDLNGEYKRDRERQTDFVSVEKYEAQTKAEQEARVIALTRIDEKLNDYVLRWEQRQREVDQTINTLSKAAAEAKQIAENQGRQTRIEADQMAQRQKDAAAEAARKQTRNITIMGIVLAAVVGLANLLPALIR